MTSTKTWVLVVLGLYCASCSSGGGDEGVPPGAGSLLVEGLVLDTQGSPVGNVPVEAVATGEKTVTSVTGLFSLRVPETDSRLKVGGSDGLAYVVRLDESAGGARPKTSADGGGGGLLDSSSPVALLELADGSFEVARPLFTEDAAEGIVAVIPPSGPATPIEILDLSLPSLRLRLLAGTRVTYPAGAPEQVFLLGVSGDRLPLPLPEGRFARMAAMVGPLGVAFDPPAQLTLPNADGIAPGGEADLFFLDDTTGLWEKIGVVTADPTGSALLGAPVERGGIFVALSRAELPTTTVVGRVLGAGNEPLPEFRVVAFGGRVALTGPQGFYSIANVPAPPGLSFRVSVIPTPEFRHEFVISPPRTPVLGGATDFGTLLVQAVLRAEFPPDVSYSPPRDAAGVSELTRIKVTFGQAMDVDTIGLKVVRGISREQNGVEGEVVFRTVGGGTGMELELAPFKPLLNDEFYTIFVPKEARDLEGNVVDLFESLSRFTVRRRPADPSDGVLRLHTGSPLEGIAGDEVALVGDNLVNELVVFGTESAFIRRFDQGAMPDGRDLMIVLVPRDISGEVKIRVRDREEDLQGDLPFRAIPVVEALNEGAAATPEGDRTVRGRGVHLSSDPVVHFGGVRDGTFALVDPSEACPAELERQCFEVTLPAGVTAGTLFLEVDGYRTTGFFVVAGRAADATAPSVTASSVTQGDYLPKDAAVELTFSEVLDQNSTIQVLLDGSPAAGTTLELSNSDTASRVRVNPPAGGWIEGASVRVVAGAAVRDLAGNPLDQDSGATGAQEYVLRFSIIPPGGLPPAVAGANVSEGASVDKDVVVELTFTKELDPGSSIDVLSEGSAVAGVTTEVLPAGTVSLLRVTPPAGGYVEGTAIRIVAGAGVLDLAGNRLDQDLATVGSQDFVLNFSIKPPPDETPPIVTDSSVSEGASVDKDVIVDLTFSEELDPGSSIGVLSEGSAVAGVTTEVLKVGTVSVIRVTPPSGGYAEGAAIQIVAGAEVLDLAGNRLDQDAGTDGAQDYVLNFSTNPPAGAPAP